MAASNEKNQPPALLQKRYARLAQRLARIGPILHGTITERLIERPDSQHPGKNKSYGPYFQWTFKRDGKTVTVNLSAAQVKRYQRALENQRLLDQTTNEMRRVSLQILELTTKAVPKRKHTK